MRKILQRLLSKLFIVSTIIIIQMIWWFFLFYTASVASRVFQDLMYVAAILLSLYIVNRRMKMYIKMSWIFLILSVPIVGIPCYFFFGRPELTSKTQKRMARIVEAYAPLRPEAQNLRSRLRPARGPAHVLFFQTAGNPSLFPRRRTPDTNRSPHPQHSALIRP